MAAIIFLLLWMIFVGVLGFIYLRLSETRKCIESFYNMIETQFKEKIKLLRSDIGVKFQMRDFFNTKGIIHQRSCVETPQQNGVVERKHQYLLNVARALKPLFP